MKINNAPSEGKLSKVHPLSKTDRQIKKGFIKADDENVRRCMQYEDKILKFKAEKKWLEDEHSSGSQSKKKALERLVARTLMPTCAGQILREGIKKMSTVNRFSEDKDKSSAGDMLSQSGKCSAEGPYQQRQRANQDLSIQVDLHSKTN